MCAKGGALAASGALACTSALGPVLQEARLQDSAQHRTRIRLWVTEDATLGRRIEFGHRFGVLKPYTEVASRFALGGAENSLHATFYSEDNGYERIPHTPGVAPGASIETTHYPAQVRFVCVCPMCLPRSTRCVCSFDLSCAATHTRTVPVLSVQP